MKLINLFSRLAVWDTDPYCSVKKIKKFLAAHPEYAAPVAMMLCEVERAESLHPNWSNDAVHAMNYTTEEVGELAMAVNDFHHGGGHHTVLNSMETEASQVCAVSLRFLRNACHFQPNSGD